MAYRIEAALQDFMNYLKHELTIEAIKTKARKKKAYVQERLSDFKDNVFCLRTRIGMYAKMKKMKKHGYLVKRAVNSMDDCFEAMYEPLYGFRTKITFEKACGTFGIACNNFRENEDEFQSRQTNEEFRTNAPTDCRTINQCKT